MSTTGKKIISICIANQSRSPMAKSLAQKMFPREFHFDSAGTDASTSGGANPRAVTVLSEYGIDLTGHLSKHINDVAIEEFDCVVTMDSFVFECVIREFPGVRNRIIRWEIEGPFYGTTDSYRSCAQEIHKNLGILAYRLESSSLDSAES